MTERKFLLKVFPDGERRVLNWSPMLEKQANVFECDIKGKVIEPGLVTKPLSQMNKDELELYAEKRNLNIDFKDMTKREMYLAIKAAEAEKEAEDIGDD